MSAAQTRLLLAVWVSALALGTTAIQALQPLADFDRSLLPVRPGVDCDGGADAFCDVISFEAYPDGADPFGITYDAATDTIWIASQAATSGNTLKQWANPIDTALPPLSECMLPTTGAGNGVAVTSNGTLLVTDFNGDLATFDDHVMEIDTACNLIRFWALDDTTCATCPENPNAPTNIDAVLGIDFVDDGPGGSYLVTITDFINTVTHDVQLELDSTGGTISASWSETGTGDIFPDLAVGVDEINATGAGTQAHTAHIDLLDCLQKNACYDGAIDNPNRLDTCTSPSDVNNTLITGITALPNGDLLQAHLGDQDLTGETGRVWTLEPCANCFVDFEGPVLGCCPGANVQTRLTGTNLSGSVGTLSVTVTNPPIGFELFSFSIPAGDYALAPNIAVPGNQPSSCPGSLQFTATLTCTGGTVASEAIDVEVIGPDSVRRG